MDYYNTNSAFLRSLKYTGEIIRSIMSILPPAGVRRQAQRQSRVWGAATAGGQILHLLEAAQFSPSYT